MRGRCPCQCLYDVLHQAGVHWSAGYAEVGEEVYVSRRENCYLLGRSRGVVTQTQYCSQWC